jgi:hypothetical protein
VSDPCASPSRAVVNRGPREGYCTVMGDAASRPSRRNKSAPGSV